MHTPAAIVAALSALARCFGSPAPSPVPADIFAATNRLRPVAAASDLHVLPATDANVLAATNVHVLPATPGPRGLVGFFDPTARGGAWLDVAGAGVGEPMNVVISGLSAPAVLTDDGIVNFARAIGFSTECFGLHLGAPQSADLGDGNGQVNQTVELRQDFGSPDAGTCLETLIGGNHFRVFRQNGTLADSGALFLAVSKEEDLGEGHTIAADGYNQGRDAFVQSALGTQTFDGVVYTTTAETLEGVMVVGTEGVNHGIALDGNAVLLTVRID